MTRTDAMPDQARADEFLVKLSALCSEFGMIVDGCGCHGSPFLTVIDKPGAYTSRKVHIEGWALSLEWEDAP